MKKKKRTTIGTPGGVLIVRILYYNSQNPLPLGPGVGSIQDPQPKKLTPGPPQNQKSIKNPLKIHQKKIRKIRTKKIENFGTDLGWFGGDFGMVWGYFQDGFGPILKSRKIESSELKKIH